jgi:hypothetical protein
LHLTSFNGLCLLCPLFSCSIVRRR